jgi:hypothetical protein
MRRFTALFAFPLAVAAVCWFAISARPQATAPVTVIPGSTFVDTSEIPAIAAQIAQRSEHLKPMFAAIHAADWVQQGAPDAYVSQWASLSQQNDSIHTEMEAVAQNPAAMQDAMRALFRIHRFDLDLSALVGSVRRYQNPALADLIESVAAGDQAGVQKLQQFVLDLADEKERQLDVEDKEAQRCRGTLANQPVAARPPAQRKTTGTSK